MVKIDDEFVRKFGFNSVEEMMAAAAEKKRLSNIELKKKYGGPIEGTIPEVWSLIYSLSRIMLICIPSAGLVQALGTCQAHWTTSLLRI